MILRLEHISKQFSGFRAVEDVTFLVQKKDIVAVIGPNGAGKTTLFNLITGHLVPSDGRVVFDGIDITGMPAYKICKEGLARSFQIINLFSTLTVFQNVQMAILARKGKHFSFVSSADKLERQETLSILHQIGLSNQANYLACTLPYGDQKLLELGIALGSKPKLLLLDEPTAGMSLAETNRTLKLLYSLVEKIELTLLFTEHNINLVFDLAQKIIVMQQGRVIAEGQPCEVRANEKVQKAYLGEV
jgi:branched-chain amino acid transport system ATP-binding protein